MSPERAPTAATGALAGPALVVGLGSAAVLVAELAAPRLLAPTVGTSIHAWAASIATFLGGLALGNAWGGRLADRHGLKPLALLGVLAAGTLLLAPLLHDLLHGWAQAERSLLGGLPPGPLALIVTPLCFLVPAVLLGTLAPIVTREALGGAGAPGRALGWLAAAGSVGAALGVLLAGYALIPSFSNSTVLAIAAALAALPAALVGLRARRAAPGAPPAPPAAAPAGEPEPATTVPGTPLSPTRLRWLSAFSGAIFLALEMAAFRIAVLGLGNSLYTWTAALAVMLGGSALGAWLGGRYADRHPPRRALAQLLLWSVLGVGVCLWTPLVMARVLTPGLPWALQCLLACTVGFLPAALALGALGPALTRAALGARATHGRAVGGMQAAGTLGAVLGALAPPFLLLPLAGTAALVALLAFWLAWAADGVAGGRQLLPLRAILTLLIVLGIAPASEQGGVSDMLAGFGRMLRLREDGPGVHVRESAYYRIRVDPERTRWCLLLGELDAARLEADARLAGKLAWSSHRRRLYWTGAPMTSADYAALIEHVHDGRDQAAVAALAKRTHHTVRQLGLDKLTHGFADLSDPTWVGYDYELVAAAVWQRAAPAQGQRAFFVGGGPYTFQRRLLALDKQAWLVTSEIDPAVTQTAFEELGLARDERHHVIHQDARLALPAFDRGSDARYHVIFGDAFNDFSVPFHLTTREFARDVQARLLPGGAYLVNVVDSFQHGAFLAAMRRTLADVFAHVDVLSLAPREDDERETFLLVASDAILDLENLTDDFGRVLPVVRYPAADLDALQARTDAPLLTDAYAPVEALLAPLARDAGR